MICTRISIFAKLCVARLHRVRDERAFAGIITIAAAVLLVVACSGRTTLDGPAGAVLTYNQVTALAVDAAKPSGADLTEYAPPVLSFDVTKPEDQWSVEFTLKDEGRPGGNFMVLVDDHTKRTRYLSGE